MPPARLDPRQRWRRSAPSWRTRPTVPLYEDSVHHVVGASRAAWLGAGGAGKSLGRTGRGGDPARSPAAFGEVDLGRRSGNIGWQRSESRRSARIGAVLFRARDGRYEWAGFLLTKRSRTPSIRVRDSSHANNDPIRRVTRTWTRAGFEWADPYRFTAHHRGARGRPQARSTTWRGCKQTTSRFRPANSFHFSRAFIHRTRRLKARDACCSRGTTCSTRHPSPPESTRRGSGD